MSGPFVTISRARIRPGRAEAYAALTADFLRDVEEQEPRLLAFNFWESEDHTSSVVIQVHPDAESFEYHLKLFGERMKEAIDYRDVEGVELYGSPSPFVEQFITHDVPGVPVTVHPVHRAGFTRLRGL